MATTLSSLKQQTLRGYRERQMRTGTFASFSTGLGTSIQDLDRIGDPDGEWDRVDSYIKFTSGVPNGTEVRVTGFSGGNGTFLFSQIVLGMTAGNTVQYTKTFSDAEVGLAINSALRDSFPERVIEGFATAAPTSEAYSLSVPSAAWGPQADLVRVDRSVGTTSSDFDYETLTEGSDYLLQRNGSAGTVIFGRISGSGVNHRFFFRRPAGEMSADTDTTDEPAHLIVLGARKFLALAEGDQAGVDRWGRELENAKGDWVKNRAPRPIRYPRMWAG